MTSHSKHHVRAAVAAAVLWLICADADGGPRDDVKEIAGLIGENYFDPERAGEIAARLQQEAAAGAFDRYEDRSALAAQLTQRLKPLDRHFDVVWAGAAAAPAGPVPSVAREAAARRGNYGFVRVERLPGNIAYLEMTFEADIDFQRDTDPARAAADAALGMLRGADAVILDLRNNGGGSPAMVGYVVSAFVAPNSDIYNTFHSRFGTRSERAQREYAEPMQAVPLYVLVGPRTASAAEAIAFTLQSSARATIVGEASAGAANPGRIFPSPQGFTVFISTGSPRNPLNGRNWEGDGVRPDVAVPIAAALLRAQELALQRFLTGDGSAPERAEAQWALEALRVTGAPFVVKDPAAYAGTFGPLRVAVVAGQLMINRERQAPVALVPLQADLFHVQGEPSRRVAFERERGRVVALELRGAYGDARRLVRTAVPPAKQ